MKIAKLYPFNEIAISDLGIFLQLQASKDPEPEPLVQINGRATI